MPPLPGHVPFGSSLSASLACWLLRRLNSSSPELTLPSNPSSRPPCEAGSRSVPSRFRCRLKRAEATLSRELRTPRLPSTHVPVRYRWQNTGSSLTNTRATSCRTPGLAIPSNPSSRPPCEAGSRSVASRFRCRSNRPGLHCPGSFAPQGYPDARPGTVPVAEHRIILDKYSCDLVSHTEDPVSCRFLRNRDRGLLPRRRRNERIDAVFAIQFIADATTNCRYFGSPA